MKKIIRSIIKKIKAKSFFVAGCIDGLKMYKHTKKHHFAVQNEFLDRFFEGEQPIVVGGAFEGLKYENRIYFGPVTPRWLGTYENEISPIISRIVSFCPEEIVDIGAAEGYYSLGMASLLPNTPVYAYETNPLSIWQQKRLKKLNGTKNNHIRRYCTREQLINHGSRKIAVICDIEGAEMDLFSPQVVSALSRSFLIIEIHPYLGKSMEDVCQTLEGRFSSSHLVNKVPTVARELSDWEFGDRGGYSDEEKLELMNEVRGQKQIWLVCEPR